MAYGSVHIPAGCTVKVGDTIGALTDLGVLKGDAQIEITYDLIEALGSKAEVVASYAKNMRAAATLELYQLYLDNIQKLLDGLATVSNQAGVEVPGHTQDWAAGTTEAGEFYPFDMQQSDGSTPTAISVEGDPEGTPDAYVLDTDYRVIKLNGAWGLVFIAGGDYTPGELIRATYTITPAASKTLKMGAASASIVSKIVEFSRTISGKNFRARLWSVRNESGLTLAFPDSANDEPVSTPVSLSGRIDPDRASGEQLIEVYDEIGLAM